MMRDIKTRKGFEFWDKLNALPRYAFLLSPSGKSVQKFEDQAMGNWIDVHEAQKVVDQAQDRISELSDEITGYGGVDFGIDGRSVRVSQEAYSIFLAREAAGREKIKALQERLNAADERADSAIGFVGRLIESAGNQPSIATGYLRDILDELKPAEGGGNDA